jgi:hypothetical protein
MKRLVQFKLEGEEQLITAEVEFTDRPGVDKAGVSDRAAVLAAQSFQKALDTIRPTAEVICAKLRDMRQAPDEIQVEFGLKLSAELGAIIAGTSGEGNITLKLTWKSEKK